MVREELITQCRVALSYDRTDQTLILEADLADVHAAVFAEVAPGCPAHRYGDFLFAVNTVVFDELAALFENVLGNGIHSGWRGAGFRS